MLEPDKLTLPSLEELRLPQTQADIFNVMFNHDNLLFTPPIRYQFRVLKKIIGALEKSIIDPEEDVCFPLQDLLFICGLLLLKTELSLAATMNVNTPRFGHI